MEEELHDEAGKSGIAEASAPPEDEDQALDETFRRLEQDVEESDRELARVKKRQEIRRLQDHELGRNKELVERQSKDECKLRADDNLTNKFKHLSMVSAPTKRLGDVERPNLRDLNEIEGLDRQAEQNLKAYGLDDSESDSDEPATVKGRQLKSGIEAKASDRVVNPQIWPHSALQFEYVNKNIAFNELSFRLFVAGELETISNPHIGAMEKIGRLNLLKKITYYHQTYDWKALLSYYAAILRQIELGVRSWADSTHDIEIPLLAKHVLPVKSDSKNFRSTTQQNTAKYGNSTFRQQAGNRVWFCVPYQRNKCQDSAEHMAEIRGVRRPVLHICASCWLKESIKREHPECSSACPHQI